MVEEYRDNRFSAFRGGLIIFEIPCVLRVVVDMVGVFNFKAWVLINSK